jgi:uncharacterized membrane protein YheB (UPF0754 family)
VIVIASAVADVDGIVDRLREFALVFLAMPLVAGLIGYLTKLAAVKMMFVPIEWRGIGPFGWQGILPKRAARMASTVVDLMTRDLIDARDIVDKLDPEQLAEVLEGPLLDSVDRIARDLVDSVRPGLWDQLPAQARGLVVSRIRSEAPGVLADILADLKANVDDVFDLKHMVVSNLIADKALLNDIFWQAGRKEFRFIINSGLPFGFAIGIVQAVVYLFIPAWWVLPLFGLIVGYATDWLALKLLFHPKQPKRILGITVQGRFLARQDEVTADYAAMLADRVLTPEAVFDGLLNGPYADALFQLVRRHVNRVLDEQAGPARPLVVMAVGSRQYEDMKRGVIRAIETELPVALMEARDYAEEALDIRNTVTQKMERMTPTQFEGLLRPAFQADEWILITVGAALGFSVGLLQDLLLIPILVEF